MRVALPTSSNVPDWEIDDRPFHVALSGLDIEWSQPLWNDPGVEWADYDAVLIRTTWDYQYNCDQFLEWVDTVSHKTTLHNDGRIIRWNAEKTYLRELESFGAALAPTLWLSKGSDVSLQELMIRHDWRRGFLKPVVGATARETHRFEVGTESLKHAQTALSRLLPAESMMFQPYLASVETEGEYSAVFFDGIFSHAVRKIPVSGDYRVQDDFGATDEAWTFSSSDMTCVREAHDILMRFLDSRFRITRAPLYARADFLRGDDGGLLLNELELIEPSLFFRHDVRAGKTFASALKARL